MSEPFRYPLRLPSEQPPAEECAALAIQHIDQAMEAIGAARRAEFDQPEDAVSPAYVAYHRAADHLREAAYRCDTAAAHQTVLWKDRMADRGESSAPSAGAIEEPKS